MDGARSLESESRHSRGLPGAMDEQAELKKTTDRILVAIPTYDEIENLPLLVDEIFSRVPEVEILVVDDNSPDGTGDWAEKRAAQDSRLSCLHRAGRLGLGTATLEAFEYAQQKGYTWLVSMDADFSHHPRYLPDLLAAREGANSPAYDVVIGSRYVPGGRTVGWPWHRRFTSWLVNRGARLLLSLSARDCSGAYRCYRVATLEKVDLTQLRSRGFSFQEEILWRLHRAGACLGEVPIVFADRTRGQSKINLREMLGSAWMLFRLGLTNWLGF